MFYSLIGTLEATVADASEASVQLLSIIWLSHHVIYTAIDNPFFLLSALL